MLEIEKNIPMPPPKKGAARGDINLTLRQMEIGDSFWIAPYTPSLHSTVHRIASRMKMKISGRRGIKAGEQGLRVWRVK